MATAGVCVACVVLAISANDPASRLAGVISAWRARPAGDAAMPAAWPAAALVSFLHVQPAHAISNIALLAWFGTLAERRLGHVTWLVFAIVAGMLTTLAELAITAHGKIGASGIVFSAGALVVATRRDSPPLSPRAVAIVAAALAAAFAYGVIVSVPSNPTGIVAHAAGLVFGGAYGLLRHRTVRYA
jgi:membrane associated rhomboid family serine protease